MNLIAEKYDALLVVSFGGPDGHDDVTPFLENVLRGRNVPRERMLEVAEHYHQFGGKSPINGQNRAIIAALESQLRVHHIDLPVYWGNRNWHPLFSDTIQKMEDDGVKNALAWFTSSFSSYSGCRQYRENLRDACAELGSAAPNIDRLRLGFNHPKFIAAQSECLADALGTVPQDRRAHAHVLFTAHSIPQGMADHCDYEIQLREVVRILAEQQNIQHHQLVFQSRSGPPQMPWLEPDVCDAIRNHADGGARDMVVVPLGFVSDHMEVIYDLDYEAAATAKEMGVGFVRAATVGTHPYFIEMIVELIIERTANASDRPVVGNLPANPDVCLEDCCLIGERPKRPPAT